MGLGLPLFDNPTAVNARWTFFPEAPAAFQNLARIAHGLLGRIPADTFHRTIPGGNTADIVKGENAVGHSIDNLFNKVNVPNLVGF